MPLGSLRCRYLLDVGRLYGDVLLGNVVAGRIGLLLLFVAADDVLQVRIGVRHAMLEESLAIVD